MASGVCSLPCMRMCAYTLTRVCRAHHRWCGEKAKGMPIQEWEIKECWIPGINGFIDVSGELGMHVRAWSKYTAWVS
jgi:hypothetical protein